MTCRRPPAGWTCSRPAGHAPPCAAWPVAMPEPPVTWAERRVALALGFVFGLAFWLVVRRLTGW